ncbi:MAG: hypothetical protein ABW321_12140, partial [Polyangiales bacterium]
MPAVPSDPLDLVVWGPDAVTLARVDELRSSPQFERFQPYLERATCTPLAAWDDLLRVTRRAVVASRSQPDGEPWLVVLDGKYTEADARRLLDVAIQRAPRRAAPAATAVTSERAGRFDLVHNQQLAASALEGRLLVLGTKDWVQAALGAIEHPAATFKTSSLWRGPAARVQCAERQLCMLTVANSRASRQLQQGLAGVGGNALAGQLGSADSALSLSLPAGAELSFAAQLSGADVAASAREQLHTLLTRASVLVSLTGLPDVLGQVRVTNEAELLRADLSVSPS